MGFLLLFSAVVCLSHASPVHLLSPTTPRSLNQEITSSASASLDSGLTMPSRVCGSATCLTKQSEMPDVLPKSEPQSGSTDQKGTSSPAAVSGDSSMSLQCSSTSCFPAETHVSEIETASEPLSSIPDSESFTFSTYETETFLVEPSLEATPLPSPSPSCGIKGSCPPLTITRKIKF